MNYDATSSLPASQRADSPLSGRRKWKAATDQTPQEQRKTQCLDKPSGNHLTSTIAVGQRLANVKFAESCFGPPNRVRILNMFCSSCLPNFIYKLIRSHFSIFSSEQQTSCSKSCNLHGLEKPLFTACCLLRIHPLNIGLDTRTIIPLPNVLHIISYIYIYIYKLMCPQRFLGFPKRTHHTTKEQIPLLFCSIMP